ncbi:MAG: RecX family transcriptional regulator [Bacteroidales bacterium]|jgi:regulatory protein|nr:RecX family transcriptional regulator [Bacteroidales bacterium]
MSEESLYKTALAKAMALCSRREYCTEDIRTKLHSWGVAYSDSQKILRTLIKENFINETRYAESFVKDKFRYNKWGKIQIAAHLKVKRLPAEIIRNALDSIDNELYIKTLRELINSYRRNIKAKNQYDLKGKLLRYGLSKGFESEILYDILNEKDD